MVSKILLSYTATNLDGDVGNALISLLVQSPINEPNKMN